MLLLIISFSIAVALGYLFWRSSAEVERLRTRYAGIVDANAAVASARAELDKLQAGSRKFQAEDYERRAALDREYEQAHGTYKDLKHEISLLEEQAEDISCGLYKPHFSFQTPEDYKKALSQLRERERVMIRENRAAVCHIHWTVGNSQNEGNRMVNQTVKLVLRAFNGECEAARADVSWNNISKMEERIIKSAAAINKLSSVLQVNIMDEYLTLKLDELHLTHEYEERRYQDREEQRRIREQIREEERAEREFEKVREEAEAEEERYQKALIHAREEAARATGEQLAKLTAKVGAFEAKLDEARKKKERAISRAQLTKSGFVYVISNIGSFGGRVFKIGMTRRLEPMDRIYELGGASVLRFDLHAMLYSDNAPELETSLHQLFAERRLNMVNARREFYRDVELSEIEAFVRIKGLSAQFVKEPEAREYRETLAKREQLAAQPLPKPPDRFSAPLFGTTVRAS